MIDWLHDHLPRWVFLDWWQYVLDDDGNPEYGPAVHYYIDMPDWVWQYTRVEYIRNPYAVVINWCSRFICRWTGHPEGVFWYSGTLEPDMHCMGCGQDLG